MRVLAASVIALALTGASPALAAKTSRSSGASQAPSAASARSLTSTSSEAPIPVPASKVAPAGRRLSPDAVLAIAQRLAKMREVRAANPGSFGGAYLKGAFHWQVSYFTRGGKKEIGQVIIDDSSGRVLEQWTGFQIAWSMARGYPGAFGRHVNSLYVWLPLCLLFLVPFVNPRRPLSLLHLDLLVLLSFSVSLAFFNHAHIYASVPLAYPPLLYLLARMLWLALRRRREPARADTPRLRLLLPAPWLLVGVLFLVGFRIGLNVTDGNVIDVGYAGALGAHRVVDGRALYGSWPADNEHGDTYGPFAYEAYVPFVEVFGFSGRWDDLPASHAAAIGFDLLALALMFWLGRRLRGPTLGLALAYAWASFPFTLYALESNSNDSLVAVLVLAALLAATYRGALAMAGRGVCAALAGLTKFAPLALAPVLASDGLHGLPRAARARRLALFVLAFAAAAALASLPALSHDSLHRIYVRTIEYQANRGSPFSVWGLYGGGLKTAELVVEIAAVALALLLAVVPRRADVVGLAAACAAVLIALQLGLEHWFYLYIPWFFGLVMIALLGGLGESGVSPPVAVSAPARSSRLAAVPSS